MGQTHFLKSQNPNAMLPSTNSSLLFKLLAFSFFQPYFSTMTVFPPPPAVPKAAAMDRHRKSDSPPIHGRLGNRYRFPPWHHHGRNSRTLWDCDVDRAGSPIHDTPQHYIVFSLEETLFGKVRKKIVVTQSTIEVQYRAMTSLT